jgi:hypothetical protein
MPFGSTFKKAAGPGHALGPTLCCWLGVEITGKQQQLEVVNMVTLERTAVGPVIEGVAMNVLGYENIISGSWVVVVWPLQAVAYRYNPITKVWDYKVVWTTVTGITCMGGAVTYDSSSNDLVLLLQSAGKVTYSIYTHTLSLTDNSWVLKTSNTISAPTVPTALGNVMVTKDGTNGDFVVYTSKANLVYGTRIPQTLTNIINFNTSISKNVLEKCTLSKADLFDTIYCITYTSSGASTGVITVGTLSLENNQPLKVLSNARQDFVTPQAHVSVSTVHGLDSLILHSPIDVNNKCTILQSFPLLATINLGVITSE